MLLGVPGSRLAVAADESHLNACLGRAEVRDVLAWMRLLVDPRDAAAVVRALSRPPIELRQVELARVIQVARRRKLDLVLGLAAVTESPQVPPEARERIRRFLALHASAAAELQSAPPEAFLARLIELLHGRARPLLHPEGVAEQRACTDQLQELAGEFLRTSPAAGTRELIGYLVSAAPAANGRQRAERATAPAGEREQPLPAPVEDPERADERDRGEGERELEDTLALLREEVLGSVARIGGRLGELRLDTELDIAHGIVRYLELLKVSALLQRPTGQSLGDALADLNARLLAAATPLQREILLTSTLDRTLGVEDATGALADGARARAVQPREQHSLVPFLPRKGAGLALSASDIHTYRSCPLRYKYGRVMRIPTEQTVHQRFGIVVHQVLERYHSDGGQTLEQMLGLLDSCWRRAGFPLRGRIVIADGCGEVGVEGQLFEKARTALTRYHAGLAREASKPVWFERQFQFQLGPHHVRGRVDRVDRLPLRGRRGEGEDAEYELIDYKTSRPKSPEQLRGDIQLSLYALAAREDWGIQSSRQAYYYVLDELKVPVAHEDSDAESVKDVVLEVAEGILAQEFEPAPAPAVCSMCDYRIVCPVAAGT